jgi:hypothetical protein
MTPGEGRGTVLISNSVTAERRAPHPNPLPVKNGERERTTAYRGGQPHAPTSFSHSSSVSTSTPCFLASASFEPAPGPATT